MEKKTINIKKLIRDIWSIIFLLIFVVCLILNHNHIDIVCLAQGLIQREYYQEFLWPAAFGKLNNILAIITFICGAVHLHTQMDMNSNTGEKGELFATNVAVTVQGIVGAIYCLVTMFCMKSFSLLNVLLLCAIIFAIFSVIYNSKAYKNIEVEVIAEDCDYELEVLKQAGKKISIILLGVAIAFALNLPDAINRVVDAGEEYKQVSEDKIELCFGHLHGIEDNRATVKVEFVNLYGSSGREYSVTELEQEYESFRRGEDDWENLLRFCDESIDIELSYHKIDASTGAYPYFEDYGSLSEAFGLEYNNRDKESSNKVSDKLGDGRFFAACVEEKLNQDGLTLRQINDTSMLSSGSPIYYYELEYETANTEQVKNACISVAAENGDADSQEKYVESIDLSISCGIGDMVGDVNIVENNGYEIESIRWEQYIEKYTGTGDYEYIDDNEIIGYGGKYKVTVKVSFPIPYVATDDVPVTVDGIDVERVELKGTSKDSMFYNSSEEAHEALLIEIYFDVGVYNDMSLKRLELGYEVFRPGEILDNIGPIDENDVCTGKCVGWRIYDVETGKAAYYGQSIASENNLCYIADIKITADQGQSLKDVNCIVVDNFYFKANLNISEYDESQHKYTAGAYPKAYFEKHLDGDDEYIMLYLPYYRVATTGVDGDVQTTYHLNGYDYGNYIYLVEDSVIRLHDKPKLEYELDRYEITDFNGDKINLDWVEADIKALEGYVMPAYPITITGYFEEIH